MTADVDDLAVLVNGPVEVSPPAGDLQIGLIDEPAVAGSVAARPGVTWAAWLSPQDAEGALADMFGPEQGGEHDDRRQGGLHQEHHKGGGRGHQPERPGGRG